MSAQRTPASAAACAPGACAALIASYSAEPFEVTSTTFDCQVTASADRRPERRPITTATATMAAAASTIHSHSSEEPDSLAAGDAEIATGDCGLGDGAGAAAAVDGGVSGCAVSGAVVSGAVVSGSVVCGCVISAGVAGSVEDSGGSVLGDRVGRETEGGDTVGREIAGGETPAPRRRCSCWRPRWTRRS